MEKLDKPVWVKMKEPELKKIIAELAEKHSPSKVGMILRDQYGIPTTRIFGKKLNAYLKEVGLSLGFEHVESSPLVRSSYHAEKHIK